MSTRDGDPPSGRKRKSAPKEIVLMTGAGGFLGKALVAEYAVVGLEREAGPLAHAACVYCDITSDESLASSASAS